MQLSICRVGVRRILSRAALALVVLVATEAAASAQSAPATSESRTEAFELTNGMRWICTPMESPGEVTVAFYVATGTAHETDATRGTTAALLELWRIATPTDPAGSQPLPTATESSPDFTSIHSTWPSAKLADALAFAAVRWAKPDYSQFEEARTKAMAIRERARKDGRWLFYRLCRTAYTTHPYGRPLYADGDLENLAANAFREYVADHLVASNLIVVLTGDVEPSTVRPIAEREFGSLPAGTPPPLITISEPPQRAERRVVATGSAVNGFAIGFHKEVGAGPTITTWDVVWDIFRKRWRERTEASEAEIYWFEAGQAPGMKYQNLAFVLCVTKRGADIASLEKTTIEELEKLAAEPLTPEEIEAAKQRMLERPERPNARTRGQHLADWLAMTGDWHQSFRHRERVRAVTAGQANALTRSVLRPENRTIITTAAAMPATSATIHTIPRTLPGRRSSAATIVTSVAELQAARVQDVASEQTNALASVRHLSSCRGQHGAPRPPR